MRVLLFLVKMLSKNENENEFMEFIQKYPECYAIAQSEVFMKFLKVFVETPKPMGELVRKVKNVEALDVSLIVLALESAGLVRKTLNIQMDVFHLTEKGKTLIEKYDAAKNTW